MTKRIDFSRLLLSRLLWNIWPAQSRRKRMRYFRCQTTKLKFQMTVWDIGSRGVVKGKERGRASYHKNLPAFQPDEEASPEVGQPKRPKRSAWETKWGGKGPAGTTDSSSPGIRELGEKVVAKEKENSAAPLQCLSCVLFLSRILSPAISEVRPYAKIRVLFRNKKSIKTVTRHFARDYFPCH